MYLVIIIANLDNQKYLLANIGDDPFDMRSKMLADLRISDANALDDEYMFQAIPLSLLGKTFYAMVPQGK